MTTSYGNLFHNSPLSEPFDTTAIPSFFSTFPVRRSKYYKVILEKLHNLVDTTPIHEGLKHQWRNQHDTPLGSDLYSVTWCESPDVERLFLWITFLEAAFVYDGNFLCLSSAMLFVIV